MPLILCYINIHAVLSPFFLQDFSAACNISWLETACGITSSQVGAPWRPAYISPGLPSAGQKPPCPSNTTSEVRPSHLPLLLVTIIPADGFGAYYSLRLCLRRTHVFSVDWYALSLNFGVLCSMYLGTWFFTRTFSNGGGRLHLETLLLSTLSHPTPSYEAR